MAKAGTYIVEDYENAKKGEPAKYTKEKLLSAFIGTDKYDLVNEQLSINEIVRENSQLITNSNYGEEDNIINNIEVKGEAIKYKEITDQDDQKLGLKDWLWKVEVYPQRED